MDIKNIQHAIKGVENMTSLRGNKVPNQFVITTEYGRYFQSYDSIIAIIPTRAYFDEMGEDKVKVYLDAGTWDYSRTTGKYRNMFLGENAAETRKKIKSGEYLLTNLNE